MRPVLSKKHGGSAVCHTHCIYYKKRPPNLDERLLCAGMTEGRVLFERCPDYAMCRVLQRDRFDGAYYPKATTKGPYGKNGA